MSLTMTIVMLISGWLAVAAAMLWGSCALPAGTIIRLSRRQWQNPIQPLNSTLPRTDRHPSVYKQKTAAWALSSSGGRFV